MSRLPGKKGTEYTSCLAISLCALVGCPIAWYTGHNLGLGTSQWIVVSALTLIQIMVLVFSGHRLSLTYLRIMYIAEIILVLWAVIISQRTLLKHGLPFELFGGVKIIALITAATLPFKKLGWFILIGLWSIAFLEYLSWPKIPETVRTVQDPWITIVVFIVSLFVFHFRVKLMEAYAQISILEEREQMLEKFAGVTTGAQHLINTPLQVLENTFALIEIKNPEIRPVSEAGHKAISKIAEVSKVFSEANRYFRGKDQEMPTSSVDLTYFLKRILGKDPVERA